ncbi:MAG: DUF2752 domain-containing protein [Firmicutes bacterium]|nr:DUF2752 domain-containing protein [Bacillota bacterium]
MDVFKKDIKNYGLGICAGLVFCFILDRIFGTCCPLRIIAGYPCPGCGALRSVKCFLSGDILGFWNYYPLMPLIYIYVAFFVIFRYIIKRFNAKIFMTLIVCLILASLGVYAYRMVKYYPNKEPMVYTENNFLNKIRGY